MRDNMKYDYHESMKLSNQFCFPIYAAARYIIQLYTPILKPLGLTYTQYLVFLVLWEKDGVSVGDICEKLKLDNGTVSPVLKKLESQEYIFRKRCENDDRVVIITLSEKGKLLQEKAKEVPEKVACNANMPLEKAKELKSLLYELLDSKKNI